MGNAFAMIDEAIWRKDTDFRRLPRFAQCTFLQLLSQRDMDCAGILTLHVDLLAKGCDQITADDIWDDLKTLESARFVYYDTDTDELLARSYIRRVAARSPNVLKAALKAARTVVSPKLRSVLAIELRRLNKADATACANEIDAGWNPSETLPEPFPNPSERGNRSERVPEPPSCSSVVDAAVRNVGTQVGETRARASAQAEPTPAQTDRDEPPPNTLAANDPEPPSRCTTHADVADPGPCRPCANFREAHERWSGREGRRRAQAISDRAKAEAAVKAEAIAACTVCGDDGYLPGTSTVCGHNPKQADTNARGSAAVRAALAKRATEDTQPEEPHDARS